jgi:hypothetical protein
MHNSSGLTDSITSQSCDIHYLVERGIADYERTSHIGKVHSRMLIHDVLHTYIDYVREAQDPAIDGIKFNPLSQQLVRKLFHCSLVIGSVVKCEVYHLNKVRACHIA